MLGTLVSSTALALRAIRRNALRASLTVLGILIGITAVCVVVALGGGASDSVGGQISNLGSNVIIIFPQAANASGARGQQGFGPRLTEDDGRALVRESTSIKAWAPVVRASAQAVFEGRASATNVIGTHRSYMEIRAWSVARGELWDEAAESIGDKVVVLGATAATNLLGTLDPVGQTLRIGRYAYKVVGVLESKGQAPFGGDQDDVVLMPLATYRSHVDWSPKGRAGAILISATSAEVNDRAVQQATAILRQRHGIGDDKEPDFIVRSQAEFQAALQSITGALTALLVAVAAVSLLVGGIGVMNIMLVSVTERTREIGIRMAIGAQASDILVQFLVEAVVLSLVGGVLGIALSFGIVALLSRALEWKMQVGALSLTISLATSTAIGVGFGFFPARRAAHLDPIQALRRE